MKQGTQEWTSLRKNYLGASDAPVIMGTSKWKINDGRIKTPYLLWQEKLGLLDTSIDNAAVRYGKEMEPVALQAYEKMVGDSFSPHIVFHPTKSFMMASLDGINLNKTKAVEIKNCSKEDHSLAKEGKIPEKYYAQLQHQLACLLEKYNINEIDYFSYHQGEGALVTVAYDQAYIETLYEKEEQFWNHVLDLIEPDLTEDDFVERDSDWVEAAHNLYLIREEIKALVDEEKELAKKLKDLTDGQPSRGGGYRYVCTTAKGAVDYKAIPELMDVDLESYRKKPIQKWFLRKEKTI